MQLKWECKDGSILITYIFVSLLIKLVLIKIKNMTLNLLTDGERYSTVGSDKI